METFSSRASHQRPSSYRVARPLVGSPRREGFVESFPTTPEQLYWSSWRLKILVKLVLFHKQIPPPRTPVELLGRWWVSQAFSTATSSYRVARVLLGSPRRAGFPCTWLTSTATSAYGDARAFMGSPRRAGFVCTWGTTGCMETLLVEGFPPTPEKLYRSSWR